MMLSSILTDGYEGTLTKNEQTVSEVYTVDETIRIDSTIALGTVSPALKETLRIGSICNNARLNEEGNFIGQSTDVALLEVLPVFGMTDQRAVRQLLCLNATICLPVTRNTTASWSVHSIQNKNSWL